MHERVDPVVPIVNPGQRLVRLAEIGQVDPRRDDSGPGRGGLIESHDLPALVVQVVDDRPAELPTAACYRYPRHFESSSSRSTE
jgi:hypothetical protein